MTQWIRTSLILGILTLGSPSLFAGNDPVPMEVDSLTLVPIVTPQGRFWVSELTYEQAQELFNKFASRSDIPFHYPDDGCRSRAHAMVQLAEKKDIFLGKAFISGKLRVKTEKRGYVCWDYHVAPFTVIKLADGRHADYVLDPSIFKQIVPLRTWAAFQTQLPQPTPPKLQLASRFTFELCELDENLSCYKPEDLEAERCELRTCLDLQNCTGPKR